MNATYIPGTARRGIGSAILLVGGAAWLSLAASVNAAGFDAAAFADDPAAHATYNRMIEAMHQARSLSYTSRYECAAEGRVLTACTYRVWLKKPNFFRMETRSTTGELEGILIGDGTRLWIHWPKGRPQWKLPDEEGSLLKPGSKAPDFDLTSVDGGRIKLSDFRGKTVWLCFWRVGCPPCRQEMPYLQSIYAKYKDQGLVVLGVDVLDDRAVTRKFLREQGVTFPNILDASPGAEEVYSRDYRVGSIPLNYLINGDGIIVDGWIGDLEGHARVNSALKTLGFGAPGSKP